MTSTRALLLTLGLSGALMVGLLHHTSSAFEDPFPSLVTSLSSPKANLEDFVGIVLGFRRLTADLAWIQTLQYYGTEEAGQTEFEFENGLGVYPDFLPLCLRVVRIDPHFAGAYLFGSSVLGWNLNRLDQATDLLKEGITYNPHEWRLGQYLAGLAYQKNHDVANLIRFLETVTRDPQCPNLLKSLLANLYKKQGKYEQALALWENIQASGDVTYRGRSAQQIHDIRLLLQHPPLTK